MDSSVTFVRIPKNASTSIYKTLGTANTIRDEKLFKFSQREKARYKGWMPPSHCLLTEAIGELGYEIVDVPSLAVVRNPYDRLVSMFTFIQKNDWMLTSHFIEADCSFNSFCRIISERQEFFPAFTQRSYLVLGLLGGGGPIGVDRVLRFENINEEFKKFIADYEIDDVDPVLPHENRTSHACYQDFFCKETKNMVKRMWEEDLDEFKYTYSSPRI